MSDVLLIDGNPDHVRPLTGLFKYRVSHELEVVEDCVSGLRRIYGNPPDVILINALLFSSEDYGFPRALSEQAMHRSIRVIVLVSGRLDEIRERSVEQYGASILELPASADELNDAIEKASTLRNKSKEPQAVSWASVEPQAPRDQPDQTVHPVAWESLAKEASQTEEVRPVNWAVDGGSKPSRKAPPPPRPQAPPEKKVFKAGEETFQAAFTTSGDGFRPMSPARDKVEESEETTDPEPFKASDFTDLKDVDPGNIKNG